MSLSLHWEAPIRALACGPRRDAAMTPRGLGSHCMKGIVPMRDEHRPSGSHRRMRHRGRFSEPYLSRGYGRRSAMDDEMILHVYEEFGKQRAQNLRSMLCLRSGRRVQERLPQTALRCSAARSGS